MFTVALFGAGKIGETICALLSESGRYRIRVCDSNIARAQSVAARFPKSAEAHALNIDDRAATVKVLQGCHAVLSALPFFCNVPVARLAYELKIHYLDLTEDVETTKAVMELAKDAASTFMPQCGLAPGFISIAAYHLVQMLDTVDTVKMRVGALPIFPSNRLKYNLTWSTDGLINEYINPCEAVEDGQRIMVSALEGYERFSLDGSEYEAFNTSGGLGTLCDTLEGQVRSLNYRTVRYPGHRDLVQFLLHDLKFASDRETLKSVLERSIPTTAQDKCIVFVEASGTARGKFCQKTYASKIYNTTVHGAHFGAIQITTASGICAPLDLLLTGKLPAKGFIKCESIPLPEFLENEFGRYYRDDKALSGIAN